MPAVSVILPTFNRAGLLEGAITSVLRQSWDDFELIVVDDGSTDHTGTLVASFRDPHVRFITQPNAGLPAARNRGIQAASGEIIAFLDDDDAYLPEALSHHVTTIGAASSTGVSLGGYIEVDAHGRQLRTTCPWEWGFDPSDPLTWLDECPTVPSAAAVRRHWLDSVGGFDVKQRWREDWDLWLRLAVAGCTMTWTRAPVARYRIHSGSMVRDLEGMHEGRLQMLDKLFASPMLPPQMVDLRNYAEARAYADLARRAFSARDIAAGQRALERALALEPGWNGSSVNTLLRMFTDWAEHPEVREPIRYLDLIFDNLPAAAAPLAVHRRGALAAVWKGRFYAARRADDRRALRRAFVRAAFFDPAWLGHRGVLTILCRSIAPSRFATT